SEDKYFFNGVNYRLILTGMEGKTEKVLLEMDAPVEYIVPNGGGFGSEDERIALRIIEERIRGNIINKEGEILESDYTPAESLKMLDIDDEGKLEQYYELKDNGQIDESYF